MVEIDKCALNNEIVGSIRGDISEICRRIQKIEEVHEKLIEANRKRIEIVKDAQQTWMFRLYITIIVLAFLAGTSTVIEAFKLIKSIL